MILKSIFYDWFGLNEWLFRAINVREPGMLDPVMLALTRLADQWNFPLYLLLWFVVAWGLRRVGLSKQANAARQAAWRFAGGFAFALVLTSVLKVAFDFPRPAAALGIETIRLMANPEWRYSLPSGHATFAALLGVSLWPVVPWYTRAGLVLFALGVGLSRIWLGAHFPADVFAGYLCGVGSMWLAVRIGCG